MIASRQINKNTENEFSPLKNWKITSQNQSEIKHNSTISHYNKTANQPTY